MSDGLTRRGGCACGAIGFEVRGEPRAQIICQCRDCQRASGAGHSALVVVLRENASIDGDLQFHETPGEGEKVSRRGFCAGCGSPIVNENTANEAIWMFHAGAFEDPAFFAPAKIVFADSGQAWDTPTATG